MRGGMFLIQCDWNVALAATGGSAWVSWKTRGEPGRHGKLTRTVAGVDCDLEEISSTRMVGNTVLEVRRVGTDEAVRVVAPEQVFTRLGNGGPVQSLDVTTGGLGVSCRGDAVVQVWDSSTGVVRRQLSGHLSDVYTCRWFPSGQVVLTGGADMQLRIWSAADGSCPVTLAGHRRAVTDTAVVDRGRNVVSVSRDGDVRLWHCGEAR